MRKIRRVIEESGYKRGIKKLIKKHRIEELRDVIEIKEKLKRFEISKQYRNHPLNGEWKGYNELHVRDDLLLIYRYVDDDLYIDLELKDLTNHKLGFSNTKK